MARMTPRERQDWIRQTMAEGGGMSADILNADLIDAYVAATGVTPGGLTSASLGI